MPGVDTTEFEPCEVPAAGILWMLRQPLAYTGQRESMYHLRQREGIMASRATRPYSGPPTRTEMFTGRYEADASPLREPYT